MAERGGGWTGASGGGAARGGQEDHCPLQGSRLKTQTERFGEAHGGHPWSSLESVGEEVFHDRGFRRGSGAQGRGKDMKSSMCVCWDGGDTYLGGQLKINHGPDASRSGGAHRILLRARLSLGLGIPETP